VQAFLKLNRGRGLRQALVERVLREFFVSQHVSTLPEKGREGVPRGSQSGNIVDTVGSRTNHVFDREFKPSGHTPETPGSSVRSYSNTTEKDASHLTDDSPSSRQQTQLVLSSEQALEKAPSKPAKDLRLGLRPDRRSELNKRAGAILDAVLDAGAREIVLASGIGVVTWRKRNIRSAQEFAEAGRLPHEIGNAYDRLRTKSGEPYVWLKYLGEAMLREAASGVAIAPTDDPIGFYRTWDGQH
jgi:hypothetical protein